MEKWKKESVDAVSYYEKESEKEYKHVKEKLKKQQDYLLQREDERREAQKQDREKKKRSEKEEQKLKEIGRLRNRNLELRNNSATDQLTSERDALIRDKRRLMDQLQQKEKSQEELNLRLSGAKSELRRLNHIISKQPGLQPNSTLFRKD